MGDTVYEMGYFQTFNIDARTAKAIGFRTLKRLLTEPVSHETALWLAAKYGQVSEAEFLFTLGCERDEDDFSIALRCCEVGILSLFIKFPKFSTA